MEVCDQNEDKTISSPRSDCVHVDNDGLENRSSLTHDEQHLLLKDVEEQNNRPQAIDPWAIVNPYEVANKAAINFVEQVASKEWYMRLKALDRLLSLLNNFPRVAALLDVEQILARLVELLQKDAVIYVWIRCFVIMVKIAEYAPARFSKFIPEVSSLISIHGFQIRPLWLPLDLEAERMSSGRTSTLLSVSPQLFAMVMPIVFDKHKEKKFALSSKLNEFCDAVVNMTNLECYVDAVCGGLTHTSPHAKFETAMFLSRHISPAISAESLKKILPCLIKCMHDADKNVREASYQAMASLLRCMREPAAQILFGNICSDKTRMTKINSYFEKMRSEEERNKCNAKGTDNSEPTLAKVDLCSKYYGLPKVIMGVTRNPAAQIAFTNQNIEMDIEADVG